ncbi:MAG: potassium transporter TrkG [Verrucomicrobiota bacterium]|nr:potassium transporter TrkG [Verrucomicrobiota bacterium]
MTGNKIEQRIRRKPEWAIVRFLATVIALGAVFLALPFSTRDGQWTPPLTALFTATSATCVTGLSVVDIGSYFSRFGQAVILVLIQVGGLGFMTVGTFLLIVVGRRLSATDEVALLDAFGTQRSFGLKSLMLRAVLIVAALEAAAAVVLAWRLGSAQGYKPADAAFAGVFHAVSALCNAGFALQADSLSGWREDPVLMGTVMTLIVLGGFGFLVWHNLSSLRPWRRDRTRRGRLSLHANLVVRTTLALIVAGWALFALFEWAGALKDLAWPVKLQTALFHAVTPRTAGFAAVDLSRVGPPALFFTIILMFVGGSPASMAGGIKTTTAAILLLVIRTLLCGHEDIEFRRRKIPDRVVRGALAIFILGLLVVGTFFLILLIVESHGPSPEPFTRSVPLLFETVSAFCTVGLSTGITPTLSPLGKVAVMILMFLGRLGPMTIALVIGKRETRQILRCPEEEALVG